MADAVKLASLALGASLDASDFQRGAQEVVAGSGQISGALDKTSATMAVVEKKLTEQSGAWERLRRSLDPAAAAAEKMERGQDLLNRRLEQGRISIQDHARYTDLLSQRYDAHTTAVNNAATAKSKFGNAIGQAGYQIQDFAVQVQGGTSALTAFGQQAPQLLSIFGTAGIIAGGVIAVGVLAAKLLFGAESAQELQKSSEAAFKSMAEHAKAVANVLVEVNNLFTSSMEKAAQMSRQRVAALETETRLLRDKEQLMLDDAGVERSRAQIDLDRLRTLKEQNETMRERQRRAGVTLDEDATGREIQSQIFAAEAKVQGNTQALERATGKMDQLTQALERVRNAGVDLGQGEFGPNQPEAAKSFRSGGGSSQSRIPLPPADIRAQEEARLQKESELAIKVAERQQAITDKELAREETRRQDSFDRTVQHYSQNLASGTVDALFDGTSKGQGFFSSLASVFGRMLKTALAGALDVVLFRPLMSQLFSELGLQGGEGGVGGGLVASGGGILGGLGKMLGIQDFSLSGIGQSLGLTGAGGLLNQTLWSSGAQSTGELAFLSSAGITGSSMTSVGSLLGGAGAGFGAGSVINSLVGGNTVGGTVGSGVGGLAGAAIGSIIPGVGTLLGGLIGGTGGGLLGGLFGGGGKKHPGGDVIVGVGANGLLEIQYARGKNWDEAAARAEAQKQVNELNAELVKRGLFFETSAGMPASVIGSGESSNQPKDLVGGFQSSWVGGGNTLRTLRSNDPNQRKALESTFAQGGGLKEALENVDWVRDVYEPLSRSSNATNEFQKSMDALWQQFAPTIQRAQQLGLATEGLSSAWGRAIADLDKARNLAIFTADQNLIARSFRARGFDEAADMLAYNIQATNERSEFQKQLEAWGIAAQDQAIRMAQLEQVQGEERLAIAKQYADQRAEVEKQAADAALQLQQQAATEAQRLAEQAAAEAKRLAEQAEADRQAAAGSAAGVVINLADYIRSLSTNQASPLSLTQQHYGAGVEYNKALTAAHEGDADALGRLPGLADTFLTASRQVFGSGVRYAQDYANVIEGLGGVSARTADQLTASFLAAETRAQTATLEAAIQRLISVNEAMRLELQQNGLRPDRAA